MCVFEHPPTEREQRESLQIHCFGDRRVRGNQASEPLRVSTLCVCVWSGREIDSLLESVNFECLRANS